MGTPVDRCRESSPRSNISDFGRSLAWSFGLTEECLGGGDYVRKEKREGKCGILITAMSV